MKETNEQKFHLINGKWLSSLIVIINIIGVANALPAFKEAIFVNSSNVIAFLLLDFLSYNFTMHISQYKNVAFFTVKFS